MGLQPGTTLGSYEVTAKIGSGGMGEVYQARDTKLDRDVALKVLPTAFTSNPDRLARFEREARCSTEAVWSPDGRELFCRNGNQLWVVDVETEPGFRAQTPRMLFEESYEHDFFDVGMPNYDVSLNGQEFLMVQRSAEETAGYVVVQNWIEELRRLVPAP